MAELELALSVSFHLSHRREWRDKIGQTWVGVGVGVGITIRLKVPAIAE